MMMASEFLKQKKEQLEKELDVLKAEHKGYITASVNEMEKPEAKMFLIFMSMAESVQILKQQKEDEIARIGELIIEAHTVTH